MYRASCVSPQLPRRPAPVCAMLPWRPPCVCPSRPTAPLPASGSVLVWMADAYAPGVRVRGRKTAKGCHGFSVPWREPRVLVIDILDEHGQPDRLRLSLYDVLLGDAEAIWAL